MNANGFGPLNEAPLTATIKSRSSKPRERKYSSWMGRGSKRAQQR